MEDNLRVSLLNVCALLQKSKVQYLIIGGTAVALHGYYRLTTDPTGTTTDKPDIDIWYCPTYENYFSLLNVIEALGHDVTDFRNEQMPNPRASFFKLEFDPFTLDLLPQIKAPIRFLEAYKRRATIILEETQIHFIGYVDLVEDKKTTARKKDLEDIEHLKKQKGS